MKFIAGTWFEVELLIKSSCLLVDGVNQNRSNAENIRSALDAEQGVLEEGRTQAMALFLMVYGQSAEQSNGHGMPRQSLSGPRGSAFSGDAARRNGIAAHDGIRAMDDIGASAVVGLVLKGEFSQPKIQRLMRATIEGSQIMSSGQWLDLREPGHSKAGRSFADRGCWVG
jgi:hypothetical protein